MNFLTKFSQFGVRATGRYEFLGVSSHMKNDSRSSSDDVRFLTSVDPSSMKKGRGGRSSFSGVVATVFGATGFMGRVLCNRLGKTGTQMIIPYRGDYYFVKHLKLMGDLGQVMFLPYNLLDEDSIRKAVKYSNAVINLVGRDYESRNFDFHKVHVEGARRIARISKEMGVEKFIHMSALNSNVEHEGYMKEGGSGFLRTKGESEDAVKEYYPDAIIFRPSDCWGQHDRFLFYYCRYFRYSWKAMPLPYSGKGIFKQPVYVGDVCNGIVNALYDHQAVGHTFEAIGPRRYELCELVDWFNRVMRRDGEWNYHRTDFRWSPFARLKVRLNDHNPSNPITNFCSDKVEREAVTDTVLDLPNLEDLGVTLTLLEDRIKYELKQFQFEAYYKESVGEYDEPAPPKYVDS
ncbi:UNVERIFIED_CONTAM: hypothetical protein RMT77_003493 [Armadillidium vulgare]